MQEIIDVYKKSHKIRNLSLFAFIVSSVCMIILIVVGVIFIDYLNLFMVLSLVVGAIGCALFFINNFKYWGDESVLFETLMLSNMSTEEIYQLAATHKMNKRQLDYNVRMYRGPEAVKKGRYKRHKV